MTNGRNRVLQIYGMWFIDIALVAVSYIIATNIRFGQTKDYGDIRLHYVMLALLLLYATVYSFFMDWNGTSSAEDTTGNLPRLPDISWSC